MVSDMIFKELLDYCSVENVVKEIWKISDGKLQDDDACYVTIKKLIEEMRDTEEKDFLVARNKNFCFIAVPKGEDTDSLYVGLYLLQEEDKSGGWENYYINQVTNYCFLQEQALGITVFKPSLEKYGVDCIVAGVLYFIQYETLTPLT